MSSLRMPLDPTNDMTRPLPRLAEKLSATAKLGDHPSEKTWRVGDLIIKASKQSERFASPLELALAAKADALVTGDNDLLALADVFAVPILTPRAFQETLP